MRLRLLGHLGCGPGRGETPPRRLPRLHVAPPLARLPGLHDLLEGKSTRESLPVDVAALRRLLPEARFQVPVKVLIVPDLQPFPVQSRGGTTALVRLRKAGSGRGAHRWNVLRRRRKRGGRNGKAGIRVALITIARARGPTYF